LFTFVLKWLLEFASGVFYVAVVVHVPMNWFL